MSGNWLGVETYKLAVCINRKMMLPSQALRLGGGYACSGCKAKDSHSRLVSAFELPATNELFLVAFYLGE
jgi:hypothetical protein